MVDFAGWSMPVQYASIVQEHHATRLAAGLFDVSHMGRLLFSGPDAAAFLDRLVTRGVADLKSGDIRYSLVTNDEGGILDDVLIYGMQDVPGFEADYGMVVNAGNREKIVGWLTAHQYDADVQIKDATTSFAMIAVQGPRAIDIARQIVDVDMAEMKYYSGTSATIAGAKGFVSRTGYTGEDGCELIVPGDAAQQVWESLLERGEPLGARAAGLGCRDTLRLEAAMPLYGHEINEQINPFQAGLGFAVRLKDRDFIGREALQRAKDDASQPRRVGLELAGRRVPREGYEIYRGEATIGAVTSGTFSPTLDRPLAMGYVKPDAAEPGTELTIDVRGRRESAVVVKLPFYERQP